MTRLTSLPQTVIFIKLKQEEGVDLSLLTSVMRPFEEINEFDEAWEFQKLKSDIYEIVSQMYGLNKLEEIENN